VNDGVNTFVDDVTVSLKSLAGRMREIGDIILAMEYTQSLEDELQSLYSTVDDFVVQVRDVGDDIQHYESIRRGVIIALMICTSLVLILAIFFALLKFQIIFVLYFLLKKHPFSHYL